MSGADLQEAQFSSSVRVGPKMFLRNSGLPTPLGPHKTKKGLRRSARLGRAAAGSDRHRASQASTAATIASSETGRFWQARFRLATIS